ncbi:serine dehydratase subunit alpha family protein [Megamonas hypermegale]|uniref:L-cysteine desulfidase family protein n=1 Tax=Megamonas hypermegale TaxID=158847 RepID=UPI00195CFEF7|nr:L-serine ammonia-lyase, iron-sulfur-dependent, subunit alpha [Megamonas hypermegale]MBM6832778.1 serine dehydratase subunit alpha family protein [Megamonas hypermegale]
MQQEIYENYINILKEQLVPALGCTEPIAIAYAGAKAREVLGEFPQKVVVKCSGNIIKNVKGVTVPNSGGLKGIDTAALLGIIGGKADMQLEVLESVTDEDRMYLRELLQKDICTCDLVPGTDNLYIDITVYFDNHSAQVVISDSHTNIIKIVKDDTVIYDKVNKIAHVENSAPADKSLLNVKDIIEFANTVNIDDIKSILERQVKCNMAIASEGIKNKYEANVGRNLLALYGEDILPIKARAMASAASEARMSGCSLPVVINSGSGNQGITTCVPLVVYAQYYNIPEEKMYRALAVSNLLAIHQKKYIGNLSAFCGAVSASYACGAAITYMLGGNFNQIASTIINTLGNTCGIICDGAKPSCAAKISSSLDAALLAHTMSMKGDGFKSGEGIVKDDLEKTIRAVGYIGKEGMKSTDIEVLNIMIDKVCP